MSEAEEEDEELGGTRSLRRRRLRMVQTRTAPRTVEPARKMMPWRTRSTPSRNLADPPQQHKKAAEATTRGQSQAMLSRSHWTASLVSAARACPLRSRSITGEVCKIRIIVWD